MVVLSLRSKKVTLLSFLNVSSDDGSRDGGGYKAENVKEQVIQFSSLTAD